jgi:hypothetical protein
MNPYFTAYMSQDAMVWLQLHPKHAIGQGLHHGTFNFNYVIFSQERVSTS